MADNEAARGCHVDGGGRAISREERKSGRARQRRGWRWSATVGRERPKHPVSMMVLLFLKLYSPPPRSQQQHVYFSSARMRAIPGPSIETCSAPPNSLHSTWRRHRGRTAKCNLVHWRQYLEVALRSTRKSVIFWIVRIRLRSDLPSQRCLHPHQILAATSLSDIRNILGQAGGATSSFESLAHLHLRRHRSSPSSLATGRPQTPSMQNATFPMESVVALSWSF